MDNLETQPILNKDKQNLKKTQKMIKDKQHEIQVFPKSKQFWFHIRHRQCYSQSNPVNCLVGDRRTTNIYLKNKQSHCRVRNGYFVTINQFVMSTVEICSDAFNLREMSCVHVSPYTTLLYLLLCIEHTFIYFFHMYNDNCCCYL